MTDTTVATPLPATEIAALAALSKAEDRSLSSASGQEADHG